MVKIDKIDTNDRAQVKRFTRFPNHLYTGCPQWVPPFLIDSEMQLNRKKHPFYEHSTADFFMAVKEGRDVGRIAALENTRFNQYHGTRKAQFYLFDCEDDQEAANALFSAVFDWARARGLDTLIGPKGFGTLDGYGLLQEGYEHRQMMNMMNYNHPYYVKLVEALGFEKEVDFVSCHIKADKFKLPDRVHSISERVQARGTLKVHRFTRKSDLKAWSHKIGETYNKSFVNNWEYYPITDRELKFLVDNLIGWADPRLIKIITHEDDVVGFLLGFPDVSAAFQRANGHLLPFGLLDVLLEVRRTKWVSLNGAGVLPEFQGRGGNALLYSEMEKTVRDYKFTDADLTQVAESARNMRADLINLGGTPYKNHRVYRRSI